MARRWHLIFWATVSAYVLIVLWLTPHRSWDEDEFEHLQGSWLVSEGLTPYKDYFEHHTPLWHLMTSWVFRIVPPDSSDRVASLLAGLRGFSLLCGAATAALAWLLARRIGGTVLAATTVALLLSESVFMRKGVEIRPDPLATLGIVAAVYALSRAFAPRSAAENTADQALSTTSILWAVVAGAAETGAILASQKALFALPGMAVAFAYLAIRQFGVRLAIVLAAYATAGAAAAASPVLAWFGWRGALGALVHYCFFLNAGWVRVPFAVYVLRLKLDFVFLTLAAAGAVLSLCRHQSLRRQSALLLTVSVLVSLIVGGRVLPVVQTQYVLMALPFAAICAAVAVDAVLQVLSPGRPWRFGAAAFGVLILGSAIRNLVVTFSDRDAATRAKLAYMLSTVPSDETVMGSWSPGVAFRRPAWFYFFPHLEIQAIIPPKAYEAFADGLRSGAVRPALVDYDSSMARLPQSIRTEFELLYEPVGVADFWRRRGAPP